MWLNEVGGVAVERITNVKRSFTAADGRPPKAVLHTTEGSWAGSLSVFRYTTGTPTFMIGRDGSTRSGVGYTGRLRIAQFMPIGEMALTLQNDSGGVETNRDCLVQIELVAFCQWTPWLPDPETTALLRKLMVEIERVAGVPLKRGGDNTRSVLRWNTVAGWFGHGETPENDHTDPRAIKWDALLVPTKEEEAEMAVPAWYPAWKHWYMVQRPHGLPMPLIAGVPSDIPQWAWDDVNLSASIHRQLGSPLTFDQWSDWYIFDRDPATRPKAAPDEINDWWWDGLNRKLAALDRAKAPIESELQTKVQQIVTLQNQVASLTNELEEARRDGGQVAVLQAQLARVKVRLEEAIAEIGTP